MSMRDNLPKIYRTAQMIIDMDVAGEKGEIDATEISDQMFIDSMTWQLPVEEKIAGLVKGKDDLPTRRKSLRVKWHSQFVKGDLESIRAVVESYWRGEIIVSYEYPVITAAFTKYIGIPKDIRILQAALRKIVPAHLRVEYIYVYRTHKQVGKYTHLQLSGYTHQEIRSRDLFMPEDELIFYTHEQHGAYLHQQLSKNIHHDMKVRRRDG